MLGSDPNIPFFKSLLHHISITFLCINYVYPLWTHMICILSVCVYLVDVKYMRHSPFSNPILIFSIFSFDANKHWSHVIINFLLHDCFVIGFMMHSCMLMYVWLHTREREREREREMWTLVFVAFRSCMTTELPCLRWEWRREVTPKVVLWERCASQSFSIIFVPYQFQGYAYLMKMERIGCFKFVVVRGPPIINYICKWI